MTLLVLYSVEDRMWKISNSRLIADAATAHSSSEDRRYTNSYAAPELLLSNNTGPVVDVWALGCILLALCTGSFPNEQAMKSYLHTQLTDSLPCSFLPEFTEEEV